MPKATHDPKRVGTESERQLLCLESPINDVADMANLVLSVAEDLIENSAVDNGDTVYLPEDQRKMLMYAISHVAVLARDLRKDFYSACEAGEEIANVAA